MAYPSAEVRKLKGIHYTPQALSDFVARQVADQIGHHPTASLIKVFDPAVGQGELLLSMVGELYRRGHSNVEVCGCDTSLKAVQLATCRLQEAFPDLRVSLRKEDFLDVALSTSDDNTTPDLFQERPKPQFDLVIANPPYVRTQVMGAEQSQRLARQFELSGRIDVYFAFIKGIGRVLRPAGVAGLIVSNRFMTTKAGMAIRAGILEQFDILHIWDLGDTRLFEAAVLPAVLLLRRESKQSLHELGRFTSIYSTAREGQEEGGHCEDVIAALSKTGVVGVGDGRRFIVRHGELDRGNNPSAVWRIATPASNKWLAMVQSQTYCTFGDVGNVRVGVKTTADKVFIRSDWGDIPPDMRPELLRPLTTHHMAGRFRPCRPERRILILYPHQVIQGKRVAVDLSEFPRTARYLMRYRKVLAAREYVRESGRKWYEIWVPQDPDAWAAPKVVLRDIAERPEFWMDMEGTVVNGDCYWLTCKNPKDADLLWLALAVGNSSFIEAFYDVRFHNKLYAGRRRFITQYVEKFPLPSPQTGLGKRIIQIARDIYDMERSMETGELEREVDELVWQSFGLRIEEASR